MTTTFESSEAARLEAISTRFSTFEGFEGRLIDYGYRSIEPYFTGSTCLELGPADGHMTARLIDHFANVTSVDGSRSFCELLAKRHATENNYDVVCALFETYEPSSAFDTIIAAHVLEHVEDPVAILERVGQWIAPGGRLIVQVPNARSFHRLLGVKLGSISDVAELNERDHEVGHRRVYDADSLRRDLDAGGWVTDQLVGSYFKIFSNDQSEAWFSDDLVHSFYELGRDFPEHGAMIAAICRPAG